MTRTEQRRQAIADYARERLDRDVDDVLASNTLRSDEQIEDVLQTVVTAEDWQRPVGGGR